MALAVIAGFEPEEFSRISSLLERGTVAQPAMRGSNNNSEETKSTWSERNRESFWRQPKFALVDFV
jgi:hypothetical protein